MTDRTHPDSGRIITSSDILLHDAETALMYEELRAAIDDGHESMTHADALAEIAAIRAENVELRAELEAVGAGGVSGPLMGQPQAMPDLTALTERGAKAWTAVDAQALREGRWYMVTHDGVATLCEDRRDAEKEAKDADMAWPHSGPHRAVQLVEASTAGFTAADMATASAQGFRDGVASLSANAGEPFGWVKQSEIDSSKQFGGSINLWRQRYDCDVPVYLAAPPTAQAEGWTKASEQLPPCRDDQLYIGVNSAGYAGVFNAIASIAGNVHCMYETPEETIDVMSDLAIWKPFNPPTSA